MSNVESKTAENNQLSGFILINKPSGPTSHDIVNQLRKITGIKKIGHAGTLDPFASGVLLCAIGRSATREISRFVKLDKEYVATIKLGTVSDTYDRTGQITRTQEQENKITTAKAGQAREKIKKSIKKFTGEILQIPPMYSAKKIGGQKLYELARQGKEIDRPPSEITIYKLKILKYKYPDLKIRVRCSSGTYIRSLAHDLGQVLGCGAYLEELERTAIGKFRLKRCQKLEKLNKNNWKKFLFS